MDRSGPCLCSVGPPRRLGDTAGQAGAWSPDGRMIAYSDGKDLFTAKSDGAESHKLISLPDLVFGPAWSPDGKVIRFRVGGFNTTQGSLWQVSVDGTNLHPLLPGWRTPPVECCGRWTTDGQYFVFRIGRQCLGTCRKGKVVWKIQRSARPADLGANELLLASAQQRWKETVRGGGAGARGAIALRH